MIPDLKGLERLLRLCRKQGVTELTCEGLSLKLGTEPAPAKPRGKRAAASPEAQESGDRYVPGVGLVPAGMTDEQFIFMSSGGGESS